ncbi:MAG: hypothetical protein PVF70_09870 [Anaerolineales bacterium]|jgi:hypothetical protein
MGKWIKIAIFALLLIAAAYFFGLTCRHFGQAHLLFLQPSMELLYLLLRLLLAMALVAVAAGLVAVLVRPLGATILILFLSGLAMLLGWQFSLVSALLVLAYLLAASIYASGISKDLRERVKFSLQPVRERQGLLLAALALVACGSLYLDYSAVIQREGFRIPESVIESMGTTIQSQLMDIEGGPIPPEAVEDFRDNFLQSMNSVFDTTLAPYQKYIPLLVALSVFMLLQTIASFLGWIPILILSAIFPLLRVARVTSVVTERRLTETLVLDREPPEEAL